MSYLVHEVNARKSTRVSMNEKVLFIAEKSGLAAPKFDAKVERIIDNEKEFQGI